MSIQKEIILRYRGEGHIRFQIPGLLCSQAVAQILSTAISKIAGVNRVKIYSRQNKLSIRYQESVCSFNQLADSLYQLLAELEKKGALRQSNNSETSRWRDRNPIKKTKAGKWVNKKYIETKETIKAARVLTKIGLKKPSSFIKDPERTIINFLNDILVLYLIKIHWTRITQEWIPHPIRFRYEWSAVFYLVYLLLRSRKPK